MNNLVLPLSKLIYFSVLIFISGFFYPVDFSYAHAICPERPACKGCGCKGGPGYRSIKNGKCVGFERLGRVCGDPPIKNCIFENAPGTGENLECVFHSH